MSSAYEIPNLRFSGEAGETIARRRFLTVNSTEEIVIAGLGVAAIGVSSQPAADGEVAEIYDGIVIVEAGAAVTAGSVVQSDATGKAITRTTGIGNGVALTAAAASGELIAVKTPAVSAGSNAYIVQYTQANLAAGTDVADVPIFVVPTGYKYTVVAAQIISQGTAAGVDDSNTAVILLEEAANAIATATYDTSNAFPASGVSGSLGTITNSVLTAGEVLSLSATNGSTADLPAFVVQVTGILEVV